MVTSELAHCACCVDAACPGVGEEAAQASADAPITCVVCGHMAFRYGVYDWRCTVNCGCPTMIGCIAPRHG